MLSPRLRRLIIGGPRDLGSGLFHRLSLIPFLAWVGLGADGLSSSAYGPEEAFRALGEHTYLAVALAALMAITVSISAAYSRIIEEFPAAAAATGRHQAPGPSPASFPAQRCWWTTCSPSPPRSRWPATRSSVSCRSTA